MIGKRSQTHTKCSAPQRQFLSLMKMQKDCQRLYPIWFWIHLSEQGMDKKLGRI